MQFVSHQVQNGPRVGIQALYLTISGDGIIPEGKMKDFFDPPDHFPCPKGGLRQSRLNY